MQRKTKAGKLLERFSRLDELSTDNVRDKFDKRIQRIAYGKSAMVNQGTSKVPNEKAIKDAVDKAKDSGRKLRLNGHRYYAYLDTNRSPFARKNRSESFKSKRLSKKRMNEGGGAGVEFEFQNADFTPIQNIEEYKYNVEELYIASYMDRRKVHGIAGTIELNLDDLKDQIIKYTDGLTYEDKEAIQIDDIDLENVYNYMYGAGWVRVHLTNGFGNNEDAVADVKVYYTINGEDEVDYFSCMYVFTPSEQCIVDYELLDEIEDDDYVEDEFEESKQRKPLGSRMNEMGYRSQGSGVPLNKKVGTKDKDGVVNYRGTDVFTLKDGTVKLNNGDWFTHTTKDRMNQALDQYNVGGEVKQIKGTWYYIKNGEKKEFNKDGSLTFKVNESKQTQPSKKSAISEKELKSLDKIVDYIDSKLERPIRPLLDLEVLDDWIIAYYDIDDDLHTTYNHGVLIDALHDLNDKIRIFDEADDFGDGILGLYLSIGEETPKKDIDTVIKGMSQIPAIINKYHKTTNESLKKTSSKKSAISEELHIMITLGDYVPWSGAVETFKKIEEADMLDELESMLGDWYPDGIGRTELNDLLWFDSEYVLSSLGLEEPEEDMEESLNEIAAERYLSVEPIEGGFIPNTDIEYNAEVVLYDNNKVVDQIMIPLYYDEIKGNKDAYIRGIAKDHFKNITDDIRVVWF